MERSTFRRAPKNALLREGAPNTATITALSDPTDPPATCPRKGMRLREQLGLQMPKVYGVWHTIFPSEQGRGQRQPLALAHDFHPI